MELQQYIKELLFRHDCVILPGFGGFVANYRPAEANYLTHTFSPPSKDIVFNAGLKDNDGLLIGYISKLTGMSYVDGRKWLDKQVKELARKLEKGKKVYLEDIGTFHLGKDKNIFFEPAKSVNFLTESFGLSEFNFSPLEVVAKEKRMRSEKASVSVGKTWRWVAVAVPLIAVLTLIPLKTNWLDNIHLDLSSLNFFHEKKAGVKGHPDSGSEPREASTVSESQTKDLSPSIKPTATESTTEKTSLPEPVVANPGKRYFIIAGSFQHRSNALLMQKQLVEEGKDAVIMNGPEGFLRVAYGNFEDKEVALKELSSARRLKGNENFWMIEK